MWSCADRRWLRTPSDGDGGGILLSAGSSLDAANATIAANRAGGSGGGIFADATSEVRLNAVTVAANAAAGPGGGGIMLANGASAIIDNSLLAANSAAAGGDDCDGSGFESGGGNLISKIAGCLGLGGSRDTVALRPGIERLGANGGPTSTVALRPSSPALGAAGADAPGRDQRNVRRRNPDAGAFERR